MSACCHGFRLHLAVEALTMGRATDCLIFAGINDVSHHPREGQPSEGGHASVSGQGLQEWAIDAHGRGRLPTWLARQPCLLWLPAKTGELHYTQVMVHRLLLAAPL